MIPPLLPSDVGKVHGSDHFLGPGGIGRGLGIAEYYDSSTGNLYWGHAFAAGTSFTSFRTRHFNGTPAGGGNTIGSGTANFALASGDVIDWAIVYETTT